jgi:hypothetical protein
MSRAPTEIARMATLRATRGFGAETPDALVRAMARREAQGWHLHFFGPVAEQLGAVPYAFAKDEAQKAAWIRAAERHGYQWEVMGSQASESVR